MPLQRFRCHADAIASHFFSRVSLFSLLFSRRRFASFRARVSAAGYAFYEAASRRQPVRCPPPGRPPPHYAARPAAPPDFHACASLSRQHFASLSAPDAVFSTLSAFATCQSRTMPIFIRFLSRRRYVAAFDTAYRCHHYRHIADYARPPPLTRQAATASASALMAPASAMPALYLPLLRARPPAPHIFIVLAAPIIDIT